MATAKGKPDDAPAWAAIRAEYVTTRITLRQLAKKHGVTVKATEAHSMREHWVEMRRQHARDLAVVNLRAAEANDIAYKEKIYDIAYKLAGQIAEVVERGNIIDYGLRPRDVTGALKDIADILHVKSEADAREQEARIGKLVKDARDDTEDKKEIVVRIEGASEEWTG